MSKNFFDGLNVIRIPEDFNPIRLVPANIPPMDAKVPDYPKHWYRGKPKQKSKDNKKETTDGYYSRRSVQ